MHRTHNKAQHLETIKDRDKPIAVISLLRNVCGGDEESMRYVLAFLRFKILNPLAYNPIIMHFVGSHGMGKTMFIEKMICALFQGTTAQVTANDLVSRFNSFMAGYYIVHISEFDSKTLSRREKETQEQALRILKSHRRSSRMSVEKKYQEPYMADNVASFVRAYMHICYRRS